MSVDGVVDSASSDDDKDNGLTMVRWVLMVLLIVLLVMMTRIMVLLWTDGC